MSEDEDEASAANSSGDSNRWPLLLLLNCFPMCSLNWHDRLRRSRDLCLCDVGVHTNTLSELNSLDDVDDEMADSSQLVECAKEFASVALAAE